MTLLTLIYIDHITLTRRRLIATLGPSLKPHPLGLNHDQRKFRAYLFTFTMELPENCRLSSLANSEQEKKSKYIGLGWLSNISLFSLL